MPYVERSIVIQGSMDEIYAIASNMEGYPEFMRDVESVTVTERTENRTLTDWVTNVDGTPIVWVEEDLFYPEDRLITYRLLEGDLDKFDGEWRFEESSEGTRVTLTVDYDFGIPELTRLIGPTLQKKVGENCEMMLAGMKSRVEGVKTP